MDSYKEAVKKCINQAAKRPLLSKPMTEVEKFYFKSKLEKMVKEDKEKHNPES